MSVARMAILVVAVASLGCRAEATDEPDSIGFRPGSQGDPEICGGCTLAYDVLVLRLERDYDGETVADVIVAVSDGTTRVDFDLGAIPLTSTSETRVVLDPQRLPATVHEASISILFEGEEEPLEGPLRLVP